MKIKFGKELIDIDILNIQTIYQLKENIIRYLPNLNISTMKVIAYGHILNDDQLINSIPGGNNSKLTLIATTINNQNHNDILLVNSNNRVIDDLTNDFNVNQTNLSKRKHPPNHSKEISKYRFESIQTLPGLIMEEKAKEILESLANDVGILAVLNKYKWKVGALCELYPDGYVGVSDTCLMGLNQNHGEKILLRIRTDDLKGFRKILSIKKVLCHELAHNIHGDHDDNFYILMRQIERDIIDLDWRNSKGYTLMKSSYISNQQFHNNSRSNISYHDNNNSNNISDTVVLGGSLNPLVQTFIPSKYLAGTAAILRDNLIHNNNNNNDDDDDSIDDITTTTIINDNIYNSDNNNNNNDIINTGNNSIKMLETTSSNNQIDEEIFSSIQNNSNKTTTTTTNNNATENTTTFTIEQDLKNVSIKDTKQINNDRNNIIMDHSMSSENKLDESYIISSEVSANNENMIVDSNVIVDNNIDIDVIYEKMIKHIEELIINAFTTEASESFVNKLLLFKDAIDMIINSIKIQNKQQDSRTNIHEILRKVFKLLYKICNNIVLYPNDMKYQRISTTSQLYEHTISQIYGMLEVLKILGFHFQDLNQISLIVTSPDPALLYVMSSILKTYNDIIN